MSLRMGSPWVLFWRMLTRTKRDICWITSMNSPRFRHFREPVRPLSRRSTCQRLQVSKGRVLVLPLLKSAWTRTATTDIPDLRWSSPSLYLQSQPVSLYSPNAKYLTHFWPASARTNPLCLQHRLRNSLKSHTQAMRFTQSHHSLWTCTVWCLMTLE